MARNLGDVCFTIWCFASVCLYLGFWTTMFFIRRASVRVRVVSLMRQVRTSVGSLPATWGEVSKITRQLLRIAQDDNSDEGLITMRTKELMEERHVKLIHQFILYSAPFLVLALTPLFFQAIRNFETGYKNHVPRYANAGWFEAMVLIYCSVACVFWEQFPGKPVRILITLLFNLKFALSMLAYDTCLQFVVARGQLSYVRLLVTLFPGDAKIACLFQALSALSICLRYRAVSDETAVALFGDNHVQLFAIAECCGTVLICGVGFMFESRSYREARATAEASNSDSVSWALKSVLSSICDVVLELDDEMRISDSAKSLALMLFRCTSRSLQGSRVQDFLTDEADVGKFKRSAERNREILGDGFLPVIPFHTRLKDTLGNHIHVEVFQCPFRNNLTNRDRYIVGVREFRDFSTGERLPSIAPDAGVPEIGISEKTQEVNDNVRVPTQGRGTPMQNTKVSLDAVSSSSGVSTDFQHRRLAVPGASETPVFMMQHVLFEAMASWNFQLPRVHCCLFHAYVKNARNVLKRSETQKCRKWTPHTKWQCPRCRLIYDCEEAACYEDGVCGSCCDVNDVEGAKVRSKKRNTDSREHLSRISL
eukprot:TRINITY_DN8506_c0_g1_i1.p1 TRINITY_DN8506_c0_g1~~TRINITY_DN8506_c0_g1_i1.p1  ORF type:complete len:595 (+),score=33.61 TRINITY_DN8506_c0_g1_i1:53-1837(+)